MRSEIEALIERVEKATGPDREIDLAIDLALFPASEIAKLMQFRRGLDNNEGMSWDIHHSGSVVFQKIDHHGACYYNGGYPLAKYTSSLDAAVALAERVLPGAHWEIHGDCSAMMRIGPAAADDICVWKAATPALALVAATLRALSQKELRK